ncbi:MAG: NAD-dependent epimerase/dehydratase family protein [Actinomycetota bacterium]|nr:NAD-dependent epimerase/dehydratase family protein [Actinomycetota bacterium]
MSGPDGFRRAVVTGAGGFIGHHMAGYLRRRGYSVRGVDLKRPEFEATPAHEFLVLDLRSPRSCREAVRGVEEVYHLGADMGGIGYITSYHADVARNNVLIDSHMLEAARAAGVGRFFYSSSACIYPQYRQGETDVAPLKEEEAYPADAEEGYGWEKLFAERLCQYYLEDHGLQTRVARFHNVYGPLGAYEGGREKAPAAICRKVAAAADGDEIEIWGDGRQTRSFTFVDDCVEGIFRIAQSDHGAPLNLGSDEMVTIDELVDLVCSIGGKRLRKRHDPSKPQGVRGRNSDNSRLREVLGWEPSVPLRDGLAETYRWVRSRVGRRSLSAPRVS